ncbi:MAG: class I SAM-dependent methyltransferase [Cyclonatronaceae bacterium]
MNPILYFLRDISKTGAVAPSSKFLANDIVQYLKLQINSANRPLRILELGPGTGTLTKAIMKALRPQDSLELVEINPHFCRMLRRKFKDEGIRVHYEDVLEFQPDMRYDYVFSSIPYESIPEEVSEQIWRKKMELCTPEGMISYYKYLNINRFRCKYEKQMVKEFCVDKKLVFLNLPPAQLFTLKMRDAGLRKPEAAPASYSSVNKEDHFKKPSPEKKVRVAG